MIQMVQSSSLPVLYAGEFTDFSDRVQIKEFFAKMVKESKETAVSLDLKPFLEKNDSKYLCDVVEGLCLATYVPKRYPPAALQEWRIELTGIPEEAKGIVREAETLAEAVTWARDMGNCPGNLLRPMQFAKEAEKLVQDLPVEIELLELEQMEKLGLNAILAVGMSSAYLPVLCILRYRGNPKEETCMGLVGKGVTCDTGGYCVKGAGSMEGIKGDMAGGAAVIGAVYALAKNRAPVNVTALIPMVENRISNSAMLPGDVITAYGGKTIEILNTDAEGRLILADAVSYAVRKEGVSRVLDIATLTGAVCRTLAFGVAGTLGDDEDFCRDFERAYETSGERYLRFPIYPEYERMIDSKIADVKNTGSEFAGSITAGLFIRRFADKTPWMHLDIAGTAWVNEPVFEYQSIGATGAGLTTMYYLCKGK